MLLMTVALVATTYAQTGAKKDWTFSTTQTVTSEYVGSTGGGTFSGQACWQWDITAYHRSGAYASFCRSLPVDRKYSHSFANETDYTIGYNTNVSGGRFNVDMSAAVYDLVPASDLYALAVAVSANRGKVKTYARAEYDAAQSARLMPALAYKIGAKGNVPKTPLNWNFWVLGRPYGTCAETVSAANLQLSWSIPFNSGTLTSAVRYQRALEGGGPTKNHEIYSVSWTGRF
jgi:hypothetical protein